MPAAIGKPAGALVGAAVLGAQVLGAPTAITVTASPMTYTNTSPNIQLVSVQAPASTTTSVAKRGVTIGAALTPAACTATLYALVGPGEAIVVTYTNAPTMQADTP